MTKPDEVLNSPSKDVAVDGKATMDLDQIVDYADIATTSPGFQCKTDRDCMATGPWRVCNTNQCVIQPTGRTLLLERARVMEPHALRDPLNGVLGDAIDRRELNLVIHLGRVENWLIQGIQTGSLDGIPTFGQTEDFGSYCGESPIECADGTCTTSFRPGTENHVVFFQVKMPREMDDDRCAFQQLELVDVHIDVQAHVAVGGGDGSPMVTSSVTVRGTLPYDCLLYTSPSPRD